MEISIMVKVLANKITSELKSEVEIKDESLRRDDFTEGWRGRINVLNPEKSEIAEKLNIKTKGNFAIKSR